MSSGIGIDRRGFLGVTAGLAAGAAFMPAASWARTLGANERIRLGVIGCGGQGRWHVGDYRRRAEADNVVVTRVCDVYRRRLDQAVGMVGGSESAGTLDYREVLDSKDVDAVIIATPDHWHTKIAIEAMEAGKDVFCEKPLSHTIEQAIECRDAVKRTGRVFAVGPQRASDDLTWKARDAIAAGRIGKTVWSQGAVCRNSRDNQFNWGIDRDAGPDASGAGYVWWDRWLGWEHGLAEKIPWNPDHFFRFRKYFAYNGGVATDLMYHVLAPLLLAISGPDGEYPRRVVAAGGLYIQKDERDIPDTSMVMVDYPSEHTIVLVSVMLNDETPPLVIRGQHGSMEFADGLILREQRPWFPEFRAANKEFLPEWGMAQDARGRFVPDPPGGEMSYTVAREPRRDTNGNFLDAIRGEAQPNCNAELGCSTMVAIKMGVEAYRQNKVFTWDAEREQSVPS